MTNVDDQESEDEPSDMAPSGDLSAVSAAGAGRALTCNPTLQELYDFIDGRLDEAEKSMLQSHFQMCTGCDDVFHFHVELRSMIGIGCREEMPPDVRQRLLDSITKLF